MSLNPVYLWNPQNFPDPQAMLPDGFDAAHRIVSEWADQPLPQGADTSAFDKLAGYIAEAARSGKASADFKAAYADIGTQVAEQLKSRAVLELYEHYLELMPILTCRSESLGLVLYDANGYLLLPDGREYPDQETQDEIMAYWQQSEAEEQKWRAENPSGRLKTNRPREAEEQKWWAENRGLPKNIKDFYRYFRPKVDELMAHHGFEYAPQLFKTGVMDDVWLDVNLLIYAKPTATGQQTIYISYSNYYGDGKYSDLRLTWFLSDEAVEQIYLHELGDLNFYDNKYQVKQSIGGGVDMEYYLHETWYHSGPMLYQTETEIEALLAYWDQKLREVAWIDTYDDIDRFYELNTVTRAERNAGKGMFTFNNFMERLIVLYLAGKTDLRERVESWLAVDSAYIVNREYVRKRYTKALEYLENRQKEEG